MLLKTRNNEFGLSKLSKEKVFYFCGEVELKYAQPRVHHTHTLYTLIMEFRRKYRKIMIFGRNFLHSSFASKINSQGGQMTLGVLLEARNNELNLGGVSKEKVFHFCAGAEPKILGSPPLPDTYTLPPELRSLTKMSKK